MINEIFNLESGYIALCDLLKICSVANSGGQAKHMIGEGFISVDGIVDTRKKAKIRVGSVVTGDGFRIEVHGAK